MKKPSRQAAPSPPSPVVLRPPRPGLLLATVFFTNFLSLACQVVWLRKISYLFGSTAAVLSTVLSVFLLGLAFGALLAGRAADRSERPWRLLGWIETGLGAYCVLSLPIFEVGRSLFLAVFPGDLSALPAALAKLAVVLLAMIAPTLAIGAVFPLAVRLYGRDLDHVGHDLSLVYGLDTLGAALGALTAGFLLVPKAGLSASTWILGLAAAGLGLVILVSRGEKERVGRKERKARRSAESEPELAPADPPPARLGVLLATFFLTGGAALLLETGWNRFFSLLNGTHVYSTSTVLAGFLSGIGLGSLLMARRIDRIRDPFAAAAWLFAAIALCGMLVFRSGGLFTRAYFAIFQGSGGYYAFQLTVCLLIGLIVLLATLAMGANFPLVARLATRAAAERGTAAGRVFFVNTLGAVLGAFLAELVLLPAWGFPGLMAAALAIYGLAAAVFLALSPGRGRVLDGAVCAALLAGAILLSPLVTPFRIPFHALYYHGLRAGSRAAYEEELRALRLVKERQGFYGQVAVVGLGPDLLLKHNGKTDASTAIRDNRTQILLGHLPLLFHPRPRRVLAIGLGGGFTLRALVHHSSPQSITAVEIDPLVVDTARQDFAAFNGRALEDPRVRVAQNDGRNFVDGTDARYDVITSEPPNIWVAGVSGLFTQEFYRSAAEHLAPRGILCQWVPLYEMKREDFRIMLHTLTSVFPQVTFWQVGSDVILLASKEPFQVEFDQVLAKLSEPRVRRDFEEIGLSLQAAMDYLNQPAVRPDQVPGFLGRVDVLNVDDKPVLEFSTARNLFELAKEGS
ncbi:MAG TPA: fused MFS/spermidine synthase [Thermoanaerobaculia bacterium]|jgi:predicted membrane-bound spermidine synthase|nr:fused MFS/spermidine synthase [Thermoanaerobaculia bacterium]